MTTLSISTIAYIDILAMFSRIPRGLQKSLCETQYMVPTHLSNLPIKTAETAYENECVTPVATVIHLSMLIGLLKPICTTIRTTLWP